MAFTPKDWKDFPDESTPLSAEGLIDLETRIAHYADLVSGGVDGVIWLGGPEVRGGISWGGNEAYGRGPMSTVWQMGMDSANPDAANGLAHVDLVFAARTESDTEVSDVGYIRHHNNDDPTSMPTMGWGVTPPVVSTVVGAVEVGLWGNPATADYHNVLARVRIGQQGYGFALVRENDDVPFGVDRVGGVFARQFTTDPLYLHTGEGPDFAAGYFRALANDKRGLVVRPFSGHASAPILAVEDASSNFLSGFDPSGHFLTRVSWEPNDDHIPDGAVAAYFDPTDGNARLLFKGKTLNGSIVHGELPLE